MEGYIKLHRQIVDNKYYLSEPFTRTQAWIDLLILANHKDNVIRVRGASVEVKRGQVGWAIKSLADRWKWSQGKVDRFLNELETGSQTVTQNVGVTTLISILNYDTYQSDGDRNGTKTGSKRGANREQTGTDNNDKNDNNNTSTKVEVFSEAQILAFDKFLNFIKAEAPDVMNMREKFTMPQFVRLTAKYNKSLIADVLKAMHNDVKLLKKYKSAYSTCESWCRRRLQN